jgi:hypothetical protein
LRLGLLQFGLDDGAGLAVAGLLVAGLDPGAGRHDRPHGVAGSGAGRSPIDARARHDRDIAAFDQLAALRPGLGLVIGIGVASSLVVALFAGALTLAAIELVKPGIAHPWQSLALAAGLFALLYAAPAWLLDAPLRTALHTWRKRG